MHLKSKLGRYFCTKIAIIYYRRSCKSNFIYFKERPSNYKVIGTRHGEKEYETLLSREEFTKAQSLDNYFRVSPDTRDLNYENFFTKGDVQVSSAEEYNSHNTRRLSIEELKDLLLSIDIVNEKLSQIL